MSCSQQIDTQSQKNLINNNVHHEHGVAQSVRHISFIPLCTTLDEVHHEVQNLSMHSIWGCASQLQKCAHEAHSKVALIKVNFNRTMSQK